MYLAQHRTQLEGGSEEAFQSAYQEYAQSSVRFQKAEGFVADLFEKCTHLNKIPKQTPR